MSIENQDMQNTIKYSIWNTRTEDHQPVTNEKPTESIEKPIQKSKTLGIKD